MRKLIFKVLAVFMMASCFQVIQAQTKESTDGKIPFQIMESQEIKAVSPTRSDPMVIGPDVYNQIGATSDYLVVNVKYTYAPFDKFTSYAAEDITVPEGQTWDIKYARSTFYTPFPTDGIASFSVIVYNNNAGKPGTVFKEVSNNTSINYESHADIATIYDATITLNELITLPAGKYWVCIQPKTDIATENAYGQPGFWASNVLQVEGDAIGSQAEFINPGGGFQALFDWTNMTDYWKAVKGIDLGLYNLNFALYGPAKTNDLAVTEIIAPTDGENLTDSEGVIVKIQNHGTQNQAASAYQMRFRINGGVWSDLEDGLAVSSGAEILYTFHAVADLSSKDVYTIEVEAVFAADEYAGNNLFSTTVENFGIIYNAEPDTRVVYTTCEGTFTDHGGLGNVSVAYSDDTVTFFPGDENSRIRLEFYNTHMSGAYSFRFYNGSTTDAPHLGEWEALNGDEGVFTQEIPGLVIEGTNPEGAVTVIIPGFDTNSSNNNFLASVTCVKNGAIDFKVESIETSKPYSWESESIQLMANVKSRGLEPSSPMVTFFANDLEIGGVSSTTLKYGETGTVAIDWTPADAGTYTLRAEVPSDNGTIAADKQATLVHEIYPVGYLVEGFEGEQYPPEGWISKIPGGTNRYFIWYNDRPYWEGKWQVSIGQDTLVTPKLHIHETDTLDFIYSAGFFGGTCSILYAPTPNGPWKTAHTVNYGLPFATPYHAGLGKAVPDSVESADVYLAFKCQGGTMDFIRGVERFFNQSDLEIAEFLGAGDPQVNVLTNYTLKVRNIGKGSLTGADYSVKLWKEINGVSTLLTTMPGEDITFSNYHIFNIENTFTTVETGKLYATVDYAADQDLLNNTSLKLSLVVIKAGVEYVQQGSKESTLTDRQTFAGYYANYTENIYHKDSLNVKGEIGGISIYYSSYQPTDYHLKLYVGETDNDNMNDGFISTNSMVEVVNTILEFGFTNSKYIQMYIPFDKPYIYSGEKNLVMAFYEPPANGEWLQGVSILATQRDENVQRWHAMQAYEMNTDVSDPVALNKLPSQVYPQVPVMTLYVKTSEMDASLAGTITDEHTVAIPGVKVTLEGYANYTKTNSLGEYAFPVMPYGSVDITAQAFGYYDQTKTGTFTAATETVVDFQLDGLSTDKISGIVVGDDFKEPINGVEVFLKGYDLDFYTVTGEDGAFAFDEVYADKEYELTFVHPKYVSQIINALVPVGGLVMDSVVMDELEAPAFNIFATITENNSVNLTWQTPYTGTLGINDPTLGITDNYWWIYNSPDEDVQIGNLFRVSKPGTVTSIEISNWAWEGSQPSELFLRFYNKDQQEFMKPVSFMMPDSTVDWMQIDVPDFSYTDEFYVMIHWNKVHQSTPAIIGRDHDDNVGYLIDDSGNWILLADHPQLGDGYGGAVSLRANTIEEGEKSTKALVSYDLWRTELKSFLDGNAPTKMNTEPIAGTGSEVTFTDETFASTGAGHYMYLVQALYTNANSEIAYSNTINKGLFVDVTINVTANNGNNMDGSRVVFANTNGATINKYMGEVAGGKIIFPTVLKGDYDLTVTHGAAYDVYESSETISASSVIDVELIEYIFTPTNLVVVTNEPEKKADLSWAIGNVVEYKLDDGTFEEALLVSLGNTAEIGNYFDINEGGQIYSVDIRGVENAGEGGKVSLVFYNEDLEVIGQTDKFELLGDSLFSVPVNNISYNGPFYAMVQWDENETLATNALAADIDGGNGGATLHDIEGWTGLTFGGAPVCFGIRVHALVSSKKSIVIESSSNVASKSEIINVTILDVISDVAPIAASTPKSVLSYNIYLGSMTAPVAEGVTSQQFTFTEAEHLTIEGEHSYKAGVQAVFATGSSVVVPVYFVYTRPVSVLDAMDASLIMYPNPAAQSVTFTNVQNSQIEIFSSIGTLVKMVEVSDQTVTIPISELPNGTFVVKINVSEGSIYRNLVITR